MDAARNDPTRWLTMERQFCRACWADGRRVKVWDLADPRNQHGRDRSFTLRQRAAILRHLRAEHPQIADREFPIRRQEMAAMTRKPSRKALRSAERFATNAARDRDIAAHPATPSGGPFSLTDERDYCPECTHHIDAHDRRAEDGECFDCTPGDACRKVDPR